MGDSSNIISVFTDSIEDITNSYELDGIEIVETKRIKLNIKGGKSKVMNYRYEREYNSVEEFNNRNRELEDFRYYIAYGSNMSLAQMGFRCRDSKFYGLGYLEGYELEFRNKYSNVRINESTRVPVVIYKISREDEKELDKYERDYQKKDVSIEIKGNKITGLIYIMKKTKLSKDKKKEVKRIVKLPDKNYFDIMKKSYRFHGFDLEILKDFLIHSFNIYYDLD